MACSIVNRVTRCAGTKHQRTDALRMLNTQPLADHPSHRVAIHMRTRNAQVIKQPDRILGKPVYGIGRFGRLVALPRPAMIRDDDTIPACEILAHPVPICMIATIPANKQKRFACSSLFIIETRPIWDRDKWHGRTLLYYGTILL